MASPPPPSTREIDVPRMMDATIRIGVVLALLAWSFAIIRPFLLPLVWGIVLAVALHPLYLRLQRVTGGREVVSAALLTLLGLAVVIAPAGLLLGTLVEYVMHIGSGLQEGSLEIPPPPERVLEWPLIGERLHATWELATRNLAEALSQFRHQLAELGAWLLAGAASAGTGLLGFALSILLAGILLARSESGATNARRIATRIAGERGPQLVELSRATVHSVTRGILGVAVIQGLAAGIGFLVVGVPGAGLWALLVMLLAVIQLPPVLLILPIIVYVFSVESTPVAIVFSVWELAAASSDNVLKPILLGRGARVPMPVIFIGVIGGFITSGLLGLFLGAIVLSVAYVIFQAWLAEADAEEPEAAG